MIASAPSESRAWPLAVAALAALLVVVGVGRAAPSWAAWTDQVGASGPSPSLSALTVQAPSDVLCSTASLSATLVIRTTPVADARYEYVAKVFTAASGGSQVGSDKVMATSGSLREATYTITDFPGLGVLTTYFVRVYARLAASPAWVAAGHKTLSFTASSILFTTSFGCGSEQP